MNEVVKGYVFTRGSVVRPGLVNICGDSFDIISTLFYDLQNDVIISLLSSAERR
jgi:hypothetical protein